MRTNRQGPARTVAGMVAAVLGLVACTAGPDGGPPSAAPTTGSPSGTSSPSSGPSGSTVAPPATGTRAPTRRGGRLRYGLEADVDGLNPTNSALSAPGLLMGNAVFDTLSAVDRSGRWVPFLAESFTPSTDFTTWTMRLRPGVRFHDETPLDAAAVVRNFESQRNDPLVGVGMRTYFPADGAIDIVDDRTVEYHLLDANAYFPASLSGQNGMVASPAWLDAALADPTLNQQPVGTGPFRFDLRSEDSVTRFVRNDDWWGGEVLLDAVEFYPVTDPATRNDLLLSGELDALQTTDPASIDELRGHDDIDSLLDDRGEESFAMLNTAHPPFDDLRARKALTFATPRHNYIELIGLEVSRGADQMFVPESPYHNTSVVQEGDMPSEAAKLAAAYCADVPEQCSGGKIDMELQFSGPAVSQTRIAELLEQGWSVAFNVTFDELNQQDHIRQVALGQYDAVTWRQFGAPDPATDNVWLMCRSVGAVSLNWPRYCDEERDRLLLRAQATTDPKARAALYREVVASVHDAYTYVFLTHTAWANSSVVAVHGTCDRVSPEGVALACTMNGRIWFSSVWIDE